MSEVRVSNEKELEASLHGRHQLTVITSDYVPAIFDGYNINFCFEGIPTPTDYSPANLQSMKHVFHPFNYPAVMNNTVFPYRRLVDKIIHGAELRIELSIDNTPLLRLCQCLLGFAYQKSMKKTFPYQRYRDKAGNVPVPFIIGMCDGNDAKVPAWSYFWWVSDYNFWAEIDNKLSRAIARFKGRLISKKDEACVFGILDTFADKMFSMDRDIEDKRLEGPDYLEDTKWDTMLSDLVKKLYLLSRKSALGGDLCKTVFTSFYKAFLAPIYNRFDDPFNTQYRGYRQMHDPAQTDLACPNDFAVDQRFGVIMKFGEEWNNDNAASKGHRMDFTTFAPPEEHTYMIDDVGNIIKFKQHIGDGMIFVYPRGMEDCIPKLCRTDAAIVSDNVRVSNSSTALPKQSEVSQVPQISTGDIDNVTADASDILTHDEDNGQAQVIDVYFGSCNGKMVQYKLNDIEHETTLKVAPLHFLAFNAGYKEEYTFAYKQRTGVWLIKDGVDDIDLRPLFRNDDKTFIKNIAGAITDMFIPFLPSINEESGDKDRPARKKKSKAHGLLYKPGLRYPKIDDDEALKTLLVKEKERLVKEKDKRLALVNEKLKMAMVKLRDNIKFKITLSQSFIAGLKKCQNTTLSMDPQPKINTKTSLILS